MLALQAPGLWAEAWLDLPSSSLTSFPGWFPACVGILGPLPGAPTAVRHTLNTFPQAVRMPSNPQLSHSVEAGLGDGGGRGRIGLFFICLVPFQTDVSFYFGLPENRPFHFHFVPGEDSWGEEHRMSVVPWGAERTVTFVLIMLPIAMVPQRAMGRSGEPQGQMGALEKGSEARGDEGD